MAKKYEFQPDKPYSNWQNKLQLTKLQQKQLLKWVLYALILLTLSVLQDVVLCRFRLHGGSTELVPCGIFVICILEGSHRGSVFALIASFLYLLSGSSPGPHSMVLITLMAILVTVFLQAYLRQHFLSVLLCTAFAMAMYELGVFAYCLLIGQVTVSRYLSFVVPAVLSLAAVPVLYPLARAVSAIGGESWKE